MQPEEKIRLRWVNLYEQTLDAELVCLRCGISRPTLEKRLRRYRKFGEEGLKSLSRRPGTSPKKKVTSFAARHADPLIWWVDIS